MKRGVYLLISGILGIFYLNLFYTFFEIYLGINLGFIVYLPDRLILLTGFYSINANNFVFNFILTNLFIVLDLLYQFLIGVVIGLIYYNYKNREKSK